MKTQLMTLVLFATLLAGCGTLNPNGPYKGDKTLYTADQIIDSSYKILHAFVKWEYTYRAALPVEVSKAADGVRDNAAKWIDGALAIRDVYSASPTPENRQNLESMLLLLQKAVDEVSRYMIDWDGRTVNPPSPLTP